MSAFEWDYGMTRIIAVANQKGGVGKTTTAVNLAAYLGATGRRVLLVDMDPQGNATQGAGVDKNSVAGTMYDVIVGQAPLTGIVVPTASENVYMAPSHRDLVGAEVELVSEPNREFRLRHALAPILGHYDFILVDCPPSLGLLTLNSLVAAEKVLVTLQCEYYALEGLTELLQTVRLVRERLNPELRVFGILLTMYQHTNLSKQVVEDVRQHLGDTVFRTVIPRNVTLSEAPSFGKPVMYYDPRCAGALAYQALAEEVIQRAGAPTTPHAIVSQGA
jgi:chromosome partitioning protein